ncbi:hypothetical protein TNCV_1084141 [Trichonephila clavipes]|nr:hypothetical protein TNCV_1084141 [Trichonephila clavipes]
MILQVGPNVLRCVTGHHVSCFTLSSCLCNTTFEPCLNTSRRVNRGVAIFEHSTFSLKEVLKHKVKMIFKNASIRVNCVSSSSSRQREAPIYGKILTHTITKPPPCFTLGTRHSTLNASAGVCQANTCPVWSG